MISYDTDADDLDQQTAVNTTLQLSRTSNSSSDPTLQPREREGERERVRYIYIEKGQAIARLWTLLRLAAVTVSLASR